MTLRDIDQLPFGVIRLDEEGRVTLHSKREKELSGFGGRAVLGRDFFAQIAPCMNNPRFRGRIDAMKARGMVDVKFVHTGDFDDPTKTVEVRAQSASDGGLWLFMHRGGLIAPM